MMWGNSLDDEDKELPAHEPETKSYLAEIAKHKPGGFRGGRADIGSAFAKAFSQKKQKPVSIPRDRNGYVYLLCVPNTPGLYKIGRASNPDNRLKTFNVKIPFPVAYEHLIKTDDCYALETMLHRLFASQRLEGEFFNLTAADVTFIKSLAGT